MLDNKGFDMWADGYDASVGLSDNDKKYPFAGYKNILNFIYDDVVLRNCRKIFDIGFGTAILSSKLYEKGIDVYGQDFSTEMVRIAKEKMPNAKLFCKDFSNGVAQELKNTKYDAIIATYSLHHLMDNEKVIFINELLELLCDEGIIYIGDVAFNTANELEKCRTDSGDEWDDEEFYFVYEELKKHYNNSEFIKISHCAGVIKIYGIK